MTLSEILDLNKYIYDEKTSGMTYREIGEELGMSIEAVRSRYRRYRQSNMFEFEEQEQKPAIEFDDWRTSFKRIKSIQEEYNERGAYVNTHERFLWEEPALIVVTSDWHIGLKSTDYTQLQNDIQSWLDNNALVIINGDIIENGIGTVGIGSATEQVISPELQHLIAKDIVNQLADNIILVTQGNHEDRSGRVLFETIRFITEDLDSPLFGNKGVLTLKIDTQEYNIFVGHKMPGGTDSNPFGAHLKVLKTYPNIDISAIGHVHTWNHAELYYQNKYVHIVTGGTYSVDEEYAVRFYSPIGSNINHYFVLNNSAHEVKHFTTLEEALQWKENLIKNQQLFIKVN
jgi:hypothetical protein